MVCFTGLEFFCDDPVLVKAVELQTCSKIFAVEILEKSDIPVLVLYDTSGEDDININATCLKALYDKSLQLHLKVPSSCFLLSSLKNNWLLRSWMDKKQYSENVPSLCVWFFFSLSCPNLTVAGRCTIYKCQSNHCFLWRKPVLPSAIQRLVQTFWNLAETRRLLPLQGRFYDERSGEVM